MSWLAAARRRPAALMVAALAAPRLARLAYPRAYILDAPYLDAAARVARGQVPYSDFVHPQTPLPEYVVGTLERLLGTTSHRVSEVVTALLALLASLLLWRLGRRRLGERAGVVAALIFAWHPYLALVHVVLREVWVVAAALLCATTASPLVVTVAAAAGFAAKPTFGLFALALLLVRPRAGLAALAGCALVLIGGLVAFGRPFWVQAVLFHLVKGRALGIWHHAQAVLELAPVLLPAALGGLWFARRAPLFVAWLLVELGFLLVLSPTVWEHNVVEVVPAAAGCAAALAIRVARGGLPLRVGAAVSTLALLATAVALQHRHDWTGLDGVPRAELALVARRLREATPRDQLVVAPLEVAAEANRLCPVHYPEIEGLVAEVDRAAQTGGLRALVAETRRLPFEELHRRSHAEWRPRLLAELAAGRIGMAVIDEMQAGTPLRALQTPDVSFEELRQLGFRPLMSTARYQVLSRSEP
jgi:hypothetical protein